MESGLLTCNATRLGQSRTNSAKFPLAGFLRSVDGSGRASRPIANRQAVDDGTALGLDSVPAACGYAKDPSRSNSCTGRQSRSSKCWVSNQACQAARTDGLGRFMDFNRDRFRLGPTRFGPGSPPQAILSHRKRRRRSGMAGACLAALIAPATYLCPRAKSILGSIPHEAYWSFRHPA